MKKIIIICLMVLIPVMFACDFFEEEIPKDKFEIKILYKYCHVITIVNDYNKYPKMFVDRKCNDHLYDSTTLRNQLDDLNNVEITIEKLFNWELTGEEVLTLQILNNNEIIYENTVEEGRKMKIFYHSINPSS